MKRPWLILLAAGAVYLGVRFLHWNLLVLLATGGVYVLARLLVTSLHRVPTGSLGLVHRGFGHDDPDDRFKVRTGGAPGPQAATLKADHVYLRPRFLYKVEYVKQTYVHPGKIGVVVAKAGDPPPLNRVLCSYVECDYFQDGKAFLLNGGQQGRQPGILPGGAYYDINPWLFEVLTVDTIGEGRYDLTAADLKEIIVTEGQTGVVITLEGAPPDEADGAVGRYVPGHESFQYPWVFLDNGGQRGAQAETLSHGGLYRINPWFARIILIPTRDLILEWTSKERKPAGSYDAALDQIVISVEGHRLRSDLTQTIQIPARAAPYLVGRFGEQEADAFGSSAAWNRTPVQRFVEKVLGSTVEGYFQATASDYKVLDFMSRHNQVRLDLEDQVRAALAEWGVVAVRTTLNAFEPVEAELDEFRRSIASERDRRQILEYWQHNREMESKTEEKIELRRISTEGERRKLDVIVLEEQIRLLGQDAVAKERLVAELTRMKVPESVVGDASLLLQYIPLRTAHELINKALRPGEKDVTPTSPPHLDIAPDPGRDHQIRPASTTQADPSDENVVEAG